MSNEILLKKGNVYFYAGFADSELTIPVIETWIYEGWEDEDGHIFQDIDSTEQYCFPKGINSDVLDKRALSEWLLEEHSPRTIGKDYVYKNI